jgi:hypothetical protein
MRTRLNRQQITGFWAAWTGWTLDGMDSVIYALVLSPALTELLPKSGLKATPAAVGYAGSVLFALFLVGWGLSLIWGPIADKYGRSRALAATILVYALFTGAAAFASNVVASTATVVPRSKPFVAANSKIRANTASCTASGKRWRVTVNDECSGTGFVTPSPRNSRRARLSLHRHAMARCPSRPSKYPTSNMRKYTPGGIDGRPSRWA